MTSEASLVIYFTAYKFFGISIAFMSLLIAINAIVLIKDLGGSLGTGLFKIAGGTIIHIVLLATYILLENGYKGLLTPLQIRFFYLFFGLIGTILLVVGYFNVYEITKLRSNTLSE